jgi:hypothetical protein
MLNGSAVESSMNVNQGKSNITEEVTGQVEGNVSSANSTK